ncbi:signal peptide peptidase SppA, 36K type [Thermodesulfatator indicus DSM 15286]|uniref:Signal peptide peptidase SppA, 36K type n=1 Tax=Thermodesulfatator indicus (strain DSM 15286 / JCM 11887 / CIR29812) TaxID=667014 RepID=F8A8Y4_THEID|nr:signal peptide peptidase SppA [Thermodesulfatator indicus]AEH44031.1 signal peptide peptidase SppA, 36K type [Thermodesulfatator indicus DSM 15286]
MSVRKFFTNLLAFLGGIFLFFLILFAISLFLLFKGEPTFSSGPKIGLIEIKGVISEADKPLKEIRQFARNKHIKAVVVRIESPGGAVGASQELYLALRELSKEKPVVASMGSVAASGGLYVALGAQKIVAAPGTITGSIGVMMQVPNLSKLLEKIGIEATILKSGPYKDTGNMFRPLREDEKKILYQTINDIYQQFVKAIEDSRGLKEAEIKKFADGRVFTGRAAKEFGLVDELGNLNDAIKLAAKMAGLKGYPEVVYPSKEKLWERFLVEQKLSQSLAVLFSPLYIMKWQ